MLLKKLSLFLVIAVLLGTTPSATSAQQIGKPAESNAKSKFKMPIIPGKDPAANEGPKMHHSGIITPSKPVVQKPVPPVTPVKASTDETPAKTEEKTPLWNKLKSLGVDADAMEKAVFTPSQETE